MSVMMRKFDFELGDPVTDATGDFGYVVSRPFTSRHGTRVLVDYVISPVEGVDTVLPHMLNHVSGCECGNPFQKCHPEA